MSVSFSSRELGDFGVAWVALGVAFTFFVLSTVSRSFSPFALLDSAGTGLLARVFLVSMLTVGVAFLLHELAHKVVAVRFGQVAEFRADYTMLALAVGAGLAGFLFAAPGAVYHRGRIDQREQGLIALAGPVTNLLLIPAFAPLYLLPGLLGEIGQLGITINAALAAFNMLPFGPLDGRTVRSWSTAAFAAAFVVSAAAAVVAVLFVGFPY
ncbi:MAG: metalloprotease [Haloarculaceae archaeon]